MKWHLGCAKSSFECGAILENLTEVLAKLCVSLEKHLFRDFTGVSSKIPLFV